MRRRSTNDWALHQRVAASGACHLCGTLEPMLPGERMVADHLEPVALGGVDALWNLAPAHGYCNGQRGTRPLTEAVYDEVQRARARELYVEDLGPRPGSRR